MSYIKSNSGPDSSKTTPENYITDDFFDDFYNEDFLAGLNVVDVWDANDNESNVNKLSKEKNKTDSEKKEIELSKSHKEETTESVVKKENSEVSEKNKDKKKDHISKNEKFSSTKDKRSFKGSRYPSRVSSRDRHSKTRLKNANYKELKDEKNEGKKSEKNNNRRRDPEKTKRDIQKDKDRRTKNEEAKIISEKLKVVETGLVPPGTEMDVDLNSVFSKMKSPIVEKNDIPKDDNFHAVSNNSRTFDEKRSEYNPSNGQPQRKSTLQSRNRSFSKSPLRLSYRHKRSRSRLLNRNRSPSHCRSRSRSLGRNRLRSISRNRSPLHSKKKSSPKFRRSPLIMKKRENNPESESERERWLKKRKENFISPSLQYRSSDKQRNVSNSMERKSKNVRNELKKTNFPQEIHKKKNETLGRNECSSNMPHYVSASNTLQQCQAMTVSHSVGSEMMNIMPAYGPPIASEFNSSQFYFNHSCSPTLLTPVVEPISTLFESRPDNGIYNEQYYIGQSQVSQSNSDQIAFTNTLPLCDNRTIIKHNETSGPDLKNKETVKKLFEEKKISLADYLTLTANKSDSSKPIDIQTKIEVISRCQDAIKLLDVPLPVDGRFVLKKDLSTSAEKPASVKWQSPLRKVPVIRFQFTTQSKVSDEKNVISKTLLKVLSSVGLSSKENASPLNIAPSSETMPIKSNIVPCKSSFTASKPVRAQDFMTGSTVKRQAMKMCQTDKYLMKCHICEIRNARKFVSVGVQCDIKEFVEIGTQYEEEQNAFKNQSLAHMTSAQILKQVGIGGKNDVNAAKEKYMYGPRDSKIYEGSYENRNLSPAFERSNQYHQNFDNRMSVSFDSPPETNIRPIQPLMKMAVAMPSRPPMPSRRDRDVNYLQRGPAVTPNVYNNMNYNKQSMKSNQYPFL